MGYFNYFLIMKEVTDFLRKTKWIEVYHIDCTLTAIDTRMHSSYLSTSDKFNQQTLRLMKHTGASLLTSMSRTTKRIVLLINGINLEKCEKSYQSQELEPK